MDWHWEEAGQIAQILWGIVCFGAFVAFQVYGWLFMLAGFWRSWDLIWKAVGLWVASFFALLLLFCPVLIKVAND